MPNGIVASLHRIDEQIAAERELSRRATHDDLTGLLSRQAVLERAQQSLSSSRGPSDAIGVLFCDLDNFKTVNDSCGHLLGDQILRLVAQRVLRCTRDDDLVARLGGDELVVVASGGQQRVDLDRVAERIRIAVAEPLRVDGQVAKLTISIGVASSNESEDVDDVIARADAAMYEAKKRGGDQTVWAD